MLPTAFFLEKNASGIVVRIRLVLLGVARKSVLKCNFKFISWVDKAKLTSVKKFKIWRFERQLFVRPTPVPLSALTKGWFWKCQLLNFYYNGQFTLSLPQLINSNFPVTLPTPVSLETILLVSIFVCSKCNQTVSFHNKLSNVRDSFSPSRCDGQ